MGILSIFSIRFLSVIFFCLLQACSDSSTDVPASTDEIDGPPYSAADIEALFSSIDTLYDNASSSVTDGQSYSHSISNVYLLMKYFGGSADLTLSTTVGAETFSAIADADLMQSLTGPFLVRFSVSPTFYFDYGTGNSTPVLSAVSRVSVTQSNATDITSFTTSGNGFSVEMPCSRTACTSTCSCECMRFTEATDAWTTSGVTTVYTEGDPNVTCRYYNSDFYVAAFANYGCALGSFNATTGRAPCTACSAGRFASTTGQTSCDPCELGRYASTEGASSCPSCPVGTYGNVTGLTSCISCNVGTYGPSAGSSICLSCTPGTYMNTYGASVCTSCSTGHYSNSAGATTCTACDAGKFASSTGQTACTDCGPGEYSSSGASSCSPCGLGTFNSTTGSSACSPCSAGRFTASYGSTVCLACAPDTYQPSSGQSACLSCPGTGPASTTCP